MLLFISLLLASDPGLTPSLNLFLNPTLNTVHIQSAHSSNPVSYLPLVPIQTSDTLIPIMLTGLPVISSDSAFGLTMVNEGHTFDCRLIVGNTLYGGDFSWQTLDNAYYRRIITALRTTNPSFSFSFFPHPYLLLTSAPLKPNRTNKYFHHTKSSKGHKCGRY